jgi:hypothetical protein
MHTLITIVASMLLFGTTGWAPNHISQQVWVVQPESSIRIHGSTSVNRFICRLEAIPQNDTLSFHEGTRPGHLMFQRSTVRVPLAPFTCPNRMIKRDFMETLRAAMYPHITLNFHDLQLHPSPARWAYEPVHGTVDIGIAQVTRTYYLRFDLEIYGRQSIVLSGRQVLRLSDFKLQPPSKIMGLINLADEVEVEFVLRLKAV